MGADANLSSRRRQICCLSTTRTFLPLLGPGCLQRRHSIDNSQRARSDTQSRFTFLYSQDLQLVGLHLSAQSTLPSPTPTLSPYAIYVENVDQPGSSTLLYIMIDKILSSSPESPPVALAGLIGLQNACISRLSIGIGPVIVLPSV